MQRENRTSSLDRLTLLENVSAYLVTFDTSKSRVDRGIQQCVVVELDSDISKIPEIIKNVWTYGNEVVTDIRRIGTVGAVDFSGLSDRTMGRFFRGGSDRVLGSNLGATDTRFL